MVLLTSFSYLRLPLHQHSHIRHDSELAKPYLCPIPYLILKKPTLNRGWGSGLDQRNAGSNPVSYWFQWALNQAPEAMHCLHIQNPVPLLKTKKACITSNCRTRKQTRALSLEKKIKNFSSMDSAIQGSIIDTSLHSQASQHYLKINRNEGRD